MLDFYTVSAGCSTSSMMFGLVHPLCRLFPTVCRHHNASPDKDTLYNVPDVYFRENDGKLVFQLHNCLKIWLCFVEHLSTIFWGKYNYVCHSLCDDLLLIIFAVGSRNLIIIKRSSFFKAHRYAISSFEPPT